MNGALVSSAKTPTRECGRHSKAFWENPIKHAP
jgi:hypothetical protein